MYDYDDEYELNFTVLATGENRVERFDEWADYEIRFHELLEMAELLEVANIRGRWRSPRHDWQCDKMCFDDSEVLF